MKKKSLFLVVLCVLMIIVSSTSVVIASQPKDETDKYIVYEEKYNICSELLQAIQESENSSSIEESRVIYLHELYVEYEDNYEVLDRFFGESVEENREDLIEKILSRTIELEKLHGKLDYM